MRFVILAIVTILIVELVRRSQIIAVAKNLSQIAQKAALTIRSSKISDHWKQKAISAYALAIFSNSLCLLGWLVLVFAPLILVSIIDIFSGTQYAQLFVTFSGVITCTIIAGLYFIIRRRFE